MKLSLLLTPALAYAPARMTMSASDTVDRRAILAGVASAAIPAVALAEAGEGPKFSFFGVTKGQATMLSEGAGYGTDQGNMYSPYGPYSATGGVYASEGNEDNAKRWAFIIKDAKGRLSKDEAFINKKLWEEVRAENTRGTYDLRNAMRKTALENGGEQGALYAKYKDFTVKLNELSVFAKRKQQAEAMASYKAMIGAYDDYVASI